MAGCGTAELFRTYELPESADVDEAPWPELVDTPSAPPPGTYTAEVPDPAQGSSAVQDLSDRALVANVRAAQLAEPVIPEAERDAMLARAKRRR